MGNTTQLLLLTANADQCVRVYSLDNTSTTAAGDGQQAVSEYTAGREGGRETYAMIMHIEILTTNPTSLNGCTIYMAILF